MCECQRLNEVKSFMNRAEYEKWNQKAMSGEVKDEENPIFIFYHNISSKFLSQIAKGEFNLQELAKRQLENRGLDINGNLVGLGKEIS